jgi:toxin ParE1/3/4
MSVRKPVVRLTPQAEQNLENILVYTRHMWGEEQTATYRTAIERAIGLLHEHPPSGRPRDDLFSGCRSVQIEQHVIYYRQPQATEIVVLRLLHRQQDASSGVVESQS